MIPRFPVYLFDIDGTLLDSAQDICGAVQQVLDTTDCHPVTFDYLKSYIGRHLIDLFSEVFRNYTPEQHRRSDRAVPQHLPRPRTYADSCLPGCRRRARRLGRTQGHRHHQGQPRPPALILEQFGLLRYFDHVQGTDGFPSKPAPDVIFTALEAIGRTPRGMPVRRRFHCRHGSRQARRRQDLRRPLRLR